MRIKIIKNVYKAAVVAQTVIPFDLRYHTSSVVNVIHSPKFDPFRPIRSYLFIFHCLGPTVGCENVNKCNR